MRSIVDKQKVPTSVVETLKGRLLYASGHTFGKCTQLAVQLVSKAAKSGPMVLVDVLRCNLARMTSVYREVYHR